MENSAHLLLRWRHVETLYCLVYEQVLNEYLQMINFRNEIWVAVHSEVYVDAVCHS